MIEHFIIGFILGIVVYHQYLATVKRTKAKIKRKRSKARTNAKRNSKPLFS